MTLQRSPELKSFNLNWTPQPKCLDAYLFGVFWVGILNDKSVMTVFCCRGSEKPDDPWDAFYVVPPDDTRGESDAIVQFFHKVITQSHNLSHQFQKFSFSIAFFYQSLKNTHSVGFLEQINWIKVSQCCFFIHVHFRFSSW